MKTRYEHDTKKSDLGLALSGVDYDMVPLNKNKKISVLDFRHSVKNPTRTAHLLAIFSVFITAPTDPSQNHNSHHASPPV
jgi:hypothetical protein